MRGRSWPWKVAALGAAALLGCACSATEGPLLLRVSAGQAASAGRALEDVAGTQGSAGTASLNTAGANTAGANTVGGNTAGGAPQLRAAVRSNMSLQYQITGELDTKVEADLFVIDLFEASAAQVASLHADGRVVIAYLSAGSLETWRSDATRFPRVAVGKVLTRYPNENWLDIRSAEVRTLMEARLERGRDKGFDGVYFSTVGVYRADSGFPLTREDQLDYDQFLAQAAHARGLSAGLSGDFELSGTLGNAFDWALANGCIASATCSALQPFVALSKPVFDLETQGTQQEVCARAAEFNITTLRKRDQNDAWRLACP